MEEIRTHSLTALVDVTRDLDVAIAPVMLLGIPEWDAAAERGRALCQELGLDLQFVPAEKINQLLGRPPEDTDWLGDFQKHFPSEDHDIIGALAIRLALADVARQIDSQCVITGLNLEDLLAQFLLRLMQGQLPLAFPVRPLEKLSLCFPAYRVPKKILDGCHPKYALANYEQRSLGTMMERAISYYLAQCMNGSIAGIEFDLLEGFRAVPHVIPEVSPEFGFATLPGLEVSPELAARWRRYVAGDQPEAAEI